MLEIKEKLKKKIILGLHFGHDAGIVILEEGVPRIHLLKERQNRAKHSFGLNLSLLEKALDNCNISIQDIDLIAITSTQPYELVWVESQEDFKIEYGEHPDLKLNSYFYEKIKPHDEYFSKMLASYAIEEIYSNNNKLLSRRFPEYKYTKKIDLGITKSLRDFPEVDIWQKEFGLKNISELNLSSLQKTKEQRILNNIFHYPMRIHLKGRSIPGVAIQHHMAHAASAFFSSSKDRAAVITHDGGFYKRGPLNGMIFFGNSNKISPLFPHHLAIGDLYDNVGAFLGFDLDGAAGKLMGLAPYGRPIFFDRAMVGNRYDWIVNGIKNPSNDWINHCINIAKLKNYDLSPIGNTDRILESICVDIAASTQKVFEETILYATECAAKMLLKSGIQTENLCFAGGTSLNCPANSRLVNEGPFDNIFIPPNCDDSGLPLGAAQYVYHHILENPRLKISQSSLRLLPYLGLTYSDENINFVASNVKDKINIEDVNEIEKLAAKDLSENKIIAWFEGRSEIGPRALGHRSLLVNASFAENLERMNTLKSREIWRPFAPAVLEEDMNIYFRGLQNESPYMLFTAQVKTNNIPAVTHVDGSARVQTVTEETGGLFLILKHLKKLSGCSVVLNTSFNGPKEPIIEKPKEALDFLLRTKLDVLYLNGKRYTRKAS